MNIIKYTKAAPRNKLRTFFVGFSVGDGTADPNRDEKW